MDFSRQVSIVPILRSRPRTREQFAFIVGSAFAALGPFTRRSKSPTPSEPGDDLSASLTAERFGDQKTAAACPERWGKSAIWPGPSSVKLCRRRACPKLELPTRPQAARVLATRMKQAKRRRCVDRGKRSRGACEASDAGTGRHVPYPMRSITTREAPHLFSRIGQRTRRRRRAQRCASLGGVHAARTGGLRPRPGGFGGSCRIQL